MILFKVFSSKCLHLHTYFFSKKSIKKKLKNTIKNKKICFFYIFYYSPFCIFSTIFYYSSYYLYAYHAKKKKSETIFLIYFPSYSLKITLGIFLHNLSLYPFIAQYTITLISIKIPLSSY